MKKAVALLLGTGLSLVSGAALAQQWGGTYQAAPPPARSSSLDNIGEEMQFVFGVDRVMGVSWDSRKVEPEGGGEQTLSSTTISLFGQGSAGSTNIPRLALDFFPVESISIGGSLIYIHQSSEFETETDSGDAGSTSTFAIAPRVGYAYAIDETFSIWPRLGITYFTSTSETPDPTSGDTSETTTNGFDLTGDVMFGISPMSNFAILIGPYLDLGLSGTEETEAAESDSKLTSFGLTVGIVGYY